MARGPSWKLAGLVIAAGLRRILIPSLRDAGGTNLVIFPANLVDGDGRGSRSQSSTAARSIVVAVTSYIMGVLSHNLKMVAPILVVLNSREFPNRNFPFPIACRR